MVPVNLPRQLNDVLIVIGSLHRSIKEAPKIPKIRHVFIYSSATSADIANWMAPVDSPPRMGLTAPLNDVLIVSFVCGINKIRGGGTKNENSEHRSPL